MQKALKVTEYTDYGTNSKIYEESTPKNRTSRRTVVINNFTYKWLLEQKRRTEQAYFKDFILYSQIVFVIIFALIIGV